MKKLTIAILVSTFLLGAAPSFADTTQADIQADKGAIAKDNTAIHKHKKKISHHRAHKAAAKAEGDYATQAKESVAIGVHQTAVGEKTLEKKVDQKILQHDKEEAVEDANEAK